MFSLQQGLAKDKVREMRELILERYDKNYDGRLEINEVSKSGNCNGTLLALLVQGVGNVCSVPSIFLSSWFQVAQILPTEQNFLLQFHRESKISSVEFMKVGMQCNAQLLVGTFY